MQSRDKQGWGLLTTSGCLVDLWGLLGYFLSEKQAHVSRPFLSGSLITQGQLIGCFCLLWSFYDSVLFRNLCTSWIFSVLNIFPVHFPPSPFSFHRHQPVSWSFRQCFPHPVWIPCLLYSLHSTADSSNQSLFHAIFSGQLSFRNSAVDQEKRL